MEIIADHLIEIFFGLVSAGALAFCKSLWNKNKKLEEMQKEDQNRKYRQMIINEIEPITEELQRLKEDIVKVDNKITESITAVRDDADTEHQYIYRRLEQVQEENMKNLNLIINSYKYRLIQLCKTHLRDGYISEADFGQISEMYKLYHGLGGNGQAQEYYEKVLKLDLRNE